MAKEDRSALNPFTGKKHFDILDDDKFLARCYDEYNGIVSQHTLLDNTSQGQQVITIAKNLINAVEGYLAKIGRSDYAKDYYDWEFHLVAEDVPNAFCMPGGKIVMYSGILDIAENTESVAFILAHEMSHALLDHSRTRISAHKAKNSITAVSRIGSMGLSLFGFGELAALTRTATDIADVGSEFLLLKPFDRAHEIEADKLGMMIINWAGYDINNIPDFWQKMSDIAPNKNDFFSTHPSDDKRIAAMREVIIQINTDPQFIQKPGLLTESANFQTKKCLNCGTLLASDELFCTSCGFPVTPQEPIPEPTVVDNSPVAMESLNSKVCKSCGKSISNGESFCTNCGTPIAPVEENTEKLASEVETFNESEVFASEKTLDVASDDESEDETLTDESSIKEIMTCSSCGSLIKDENTSFCTNCGTPIANVDLKESEIASETETLDEDSSFESTASEVDSEVSIEDMDTFYKDSEDEEALDVASDDESENVSCEVTEEALDVATEVESTSEDEVLTDESSIKEIMTCSSCGSLIKDENASFCTNCGAPLAKTILCPSCSSPVGADDVFCTNCGTNLKEKERFCSKCGSKVKSSDNFCISCGTKL